MTNRDRVAEGVRNWMHHIDTHPVWEPTALWGDIYIQRMLGGVLLKCKRPDVGGYIVAEVKDGDVDSVTDMACWVRAQCNLSSDG